MWQKVMFYLLQAKGKGQNMTRLIAHLLADTEMIISSLL